MGCCTSKKNGLDDKRRIIDHFMPPGSSRQPLFAYRLEKVEDLDMRRMQRGGTGGVGGAVGASNVVADLPPSPRSSPRGGPGGGAYLELKEFHSSGDARFCSPGSEEDLSRQLMARLGPCDVPLVGEGRYLLVESRVGPQSSETVHYSTEEVTATEEELVRLVEARADDGQRFVSNCFGLATFEVTREKPKGVLLETLASDEGVDFDDVLDRVRELALKGWRFRGCLRGRSQIQEFVLGYAMYADVVVSPFSHLCFALDPAAPRMQIEVVELRGMGNVISGSLLEIIRAWARRGWRLSCVMYNLVTTYDRVNLDPPEGGGGGGLGGGCGGGGGGGGEAASLPGGGDGDAATTDRFVGLGEEVGGLGELGLYYHVGAFFERRHVPVEEGQIQARLALQRRRANEPGLDRDPLYSNGGADGNSPRSGGGPGPVPHPLATGVQV